MITIGTGSSRPASNIPIPGTSHATATNAGATVTAGKNPPRQPVRHSAARGPRPAEKPSPLTPSITQNGCVLLSGTVRFFAYPAEPDSRGVARIRHLPLVFPSRKHGGWS